MHPAPSLVPSLAFTRSGPIHRGHRFYRVTTLLTIFAMLFGGILLLSAPTAQAGAPTTTSTVNLRTAPSPDADVISILQPGTPVEVTGEAENGFLPVSAEGNWGYVSADFVSYGGGGDVATEGATDEAAADGMGGSQAPAGEASAGSESTWSGGGERLYVIDGALNLRSGPSSSDGIVTVMRDGAVVTTTGESANGFLGVSYNGMMGYASGEFLSAWERVQTPDTDTGSGEEPAADDRTQTWEDPRDTPGEGDTGSVPVGDTATGSATVVDGPLNLRTGPSTSYQILDVMPTGATLELMGAVQDGFHPVRYNGVTGWASAEFIGVGGDVSNPVPDDDATTPDTGEGDTGSVPVPGDTPTGSALVIDGALNLRSGPSITSTILTVMPNSTQVDLLGDPQNGFYPVRFNGIDGWAFGDYLSMSGGTPDPGDGVDVPDDDTGDPGTAPTPAPEQPAPDPGTGNPDSNGDGAYSRDEMVAVITSAANAYGQPVDDMIRVAGCESVFDPAAVNSSSGASGLFQFMPGTWLTTPYADQDIFDPVANANAAAWMWSVGRRNEWTCQ